MQLASVIRKIYYQHLCNKTQVIKTEEAITERVYKWFHVLVDVFQTSTNILRVAA